jgi:hypothetical protein
MTCAIAVLRYGSCEDASEVNGLHRIRIYAAGGSLGFNKAVDLRS